MNGKLAVIIMTTVLIIGGLVGGLSAFANNGSDEEDTLIRLTAEEAQEQLIEDAPVPVPPVLPVLVQDATMIELRVGDTHTIGLESNPTTGYSWQVGFEFNENLLELVDQSYEQVSNLVGAGGKEFFIFRALAHGMVEFSFDYKRPWEDEVLKTERFIFNIGVSETLAEEMSEAEAREIAANSECGKVGALKENAQYNDWSGTWWIDLEVEKEGSWPACVVNVVTEQAELNWRIMGVLPPAQQ